MSTENSPQVWRVECDDGVREVTVTREEDGYIRTEAADRTALAFHPETPPRAAVATFAGRCGWPVVGVLAPGQPTRAELEARNADLSRDRDTALAAALDLAADRDATRAILEGRTTPPTDAEIDAHAATGGAWLVAIAITDGALPALVVADHHAARRYARQDPRAEWTATRWIAVGADRRPTTWPVVEETR